MFHRPCVSAKSMKGNEAYALIHIHSYRILREGNIMAEEERVGEKVIETIENV